MIKIREALIRPLSLNIQAKQPGLMRGMAANEVKVYFYSRTGAFMQIKIGAINSRGECLVRFEGENVRATKEGGKWVYRIAAPKVHEDE